MEQNVNSDEFYTHLKEQFTPADFSEHIGVLLSNHSEKEEIEKATKFLQVVYCIATDYF